MTGQVILGVKPEPDGKGEADPMKKRENFSPEQKRKEKENREVRDRESRPGLGNRKLEGPDRPGT